MIHVLTGKLRTKLVGQHPTPYKSSLEALKKGPITVGIDPPRPVKSS